MRIFFWVMMAGLCTVAAKAQDFPCKMNDYRIVDPSTLVVLCDGVPLPPNDFSVTAGSLFFVENESIVHPAVGKVSTVTAGGERWWLRFQFDKPLVGEKDYELQFDGSVKFEGALKEVPGKFANARLRFSTKATATIGNITQREVALQSHVALDPKTIVDAKLSQKLSQGADFKPIESKLIPFRDTTPPQNNEFVGDARLDQAPSVEGSFKVDGLKDIFGSAVTIDPTKHAPPITAPKSKDDANYYFNFLHEAGVGITPTWVADIKAAPVLGRSPGDLYWSPSFIANVGTGSVGGTKATDDIKGSIGVTRWFRNNGTFEGIQATPSLSYETDRENDKRNALFDGDVQFFFKGLSNTRAEGQTDLFILCRQPGTQPKVCKDKGLDKNSQLTDVKVDFGYRFQFFLGAEDGGALVATTAKSTDKSSQVVVPTYSIARVRPRMVTTLEWKAVTVTVTAIPRYLFTEENVTRQTPIVVNGSTKQKIYLDTASGWRPYGEVAINIALDPAGHYAIGTTYKIGSEPPNFDEANFFQSGLTIRF